MESLQLAQRRIPKADLAAGIGVSFLVHVLAFSAAFIAAWIMPHKPIKPPFCTVDLVSLKDIGMGDTEPKGNPKAPEEALNSGATRSSGKTVEKSSPVMPVKRLHLDDTSRNEEAPIKKIEPREVPKFEETPQDLASIEKNLDKLITKPKVVPRTTVPVEAPSVGTAKPAAQEPAAGRPGGSPSTSEHVARGTPNGAAEGGSRGATQGSTAGSPEGSSAVSALVGLYGEKVRSVIEREWRLVNDQGIGGLKTVVEVQIRKSGEVVSIQVVKTSGNSNFDESAVRAVQKASPLPAVPEVIVQPSTKLILTFLPGRVS